MNNEHRFPLAPKTTTGLENTETLSRSEGQPLYRNETFAARPAQETSCCRHFPRHSVPTPRQVDMLSTSSLLLFASVLGGSEANYANTYSGLPSDFQSALSGAKAWMDHLPSIGTS